MVKKVNIALYISSRLYSNSEAFASELLYNLKNVPSVLFKRCHDNFLCMDIEKISDTKVIIFMVKVEINVHFQTQTVDIKYYKHCTIHI